MPTVLRIGRYRFLPIELNRCAVADGLRGLLLFVRFCFSPLFS